MKLKGIYTNEDTVVNSVEERANLYATLLFIMNYDSTLAQAEEMKERHYSKKVMRVFESGRTSDLREACRIVDAEEEGNQVYQRIADTREEAVEILLNAYYAPGESFVATREPAVRQAYSKYIASTLIVALRGRWIVNSWWRLVDWGFSVEPFNDKDEEVAFPYKSYEELTGTDKEAFDMLVEEYYSLCETNLYAQMGLEKKALPEEQRADYKPEYPTYPIEGYSMEEILQSYEGKLTEEDIREGWDCDILRFLPMLISRFGEAMYYALKYQGSEYKEYIKSLNVAEDWDVVYKDNPEDTYAKIMEE